MEQELLKWITFLCSQKNYHNLCISYPVLTSVKDYESINHQLHLQLLQALSKLPLITSSAFQHSDVLLWEAQDTQFNTKDLEKIDEFTLSKALYLPSKIIFVKGPQNFSLSVANKILKILEDPPIPLSFILLGFSYGKLLPTVKSRFLNWRPSLKEIELLHPHIAVKNSPSWPELKNIDDFEQWANDNSQDIEDCLEYLWRSFLPSCTQASAIERLMSFQQWFEKSKLWHNPEQERWYFLFQMAKNSLNYGLSSKT